MANRGRVSAAQIEAGGAVALIKRPDAPLDLTPDETSEWQGLVDAMPADWFTRETHALLKQYCRHAIAAQRVAQLIDLEMSREELDVVALDKLLSMQARETGALKAMAASMRVSQQASYTAQRAGTQKGNRSVKRPWE